MTDKGALEKEGAGENPSSISSLSVLSLSSLLLQMSEDAILDPLLVARHVGGKTSIIAARTMKRA
jgi:hypothetical protein